MAITRMTYQSGWRISRKSSDEIEVTPEMIEAVADRLSAFNPD
jgi:hypothetical protein